MKTIFYVNRGCGFTSRRRYKRAAKGVRQRRRRKLLRAWRLVRQRQRRSRAGLSKSGRALLKGVRARQRCWLLKFGLLYDTENGVARDSKKATRFTQKPAIRAMRQAAKPDFTYANGRGAKQDYAKLANLRQSLRCG